MGKPYNEVLEKSTYDNEKSYVISAFSLLLYSTSIVRVKFLLSQK